MFYHRGHRGVRVSRKGICIEVLFIGLGSMKTLVLNEIRKNVNLEC